MDYRRCFGLRAPLPIGDSTVLVPQMENYSLFASPYLDLNKKIGKAIEGFQQELKSQSEGDSTEKRTTRRGAKKKEEDVQKPSKETVKSNESFGIVLNVATLKPEDVSIAFGKGNEIEVKIEQMDVKLEYGCPPFSRNCTYRYELPDDVDKNSLVGLWTSDDYLIILPKDNLRKELLDKSIGIPNKPDEPSDPVVASSEETKIKCVDEKLEGKAGATKGEGKKAKKPSKSGDDKGKAKQKKASDQSTGESATETYCANSAITVYPVTRMLRPELDIFMLRKYVLDLESYASTVRKFIESASFLSQNSKSAERCIRYLASLHADEFYEKINLKGGKEGKMRRKRGPSPDSGYGTSSSSGGEKAVDNLTGLLTT